MGPAVACFGAMHSAADWLPESALQFPLTLRVSHSALPLPQVAVPLPLPTARASGASVDAAHHPPGLLAHWLSALLLSDSCSACCMPASGQTPIAQAALAALDMPVALALPVALLPTAAGRPLFPGFSCPQGPRAQSADVVLHAPHCTLW